jgi:hypothetical protein
MESTVSPEAGAIRPLLEEGRFGKSIGQKAFGVWIPAV